jgi:hypothetical protein
MYTHRDEGGIEGREIARRFIQDFVAQIFIKCPKISDVDEKTRVVLAHHILHFPLACAVF